MLGGVEECTRPNGPVATTNTETSRSHRRGRRLPLGPQSETKTALLLVARNMVAASFFCLSAQYYSDDHSDDHTQMHADTP